LSLSYKFLLLLLAAIPSSEYRAGSCSEQALFKDGLAAAGGFEQQHQFCSARCLFLYFLFESMISDFALCAKPTANPLCQF
jgi:hypothetical protein